MKLGGGGIQQVSADCLESGWSVGEMCLKFLPQFSSHPNELATPDSYCILMCMKHFFCSLTKGFQSLAPCFEILICLICEKARRV